MIFRKEKPDYSSTRFKRLMKDVALERCLIDNFGKKEPYTTVYLNEPSIRCTHVSPVEVSTHSLNSTEISEGASHFEDVAFYPFKTFWIHDYLYGDLYLKINAGICNHCGTIYVQERG